MADDVTNVDDWGFTDADHSELQALMTKHQARALSVILDLMAHGGVAAAPDDMGPMGTIIVRSDGQARGFPPGGFWWALLDRLRALE